MQTPESEIIVTIIAGTILLLLLVSFIVLFLFLHQRRAFNHKRQVQKLQEEFSQAQIELQEQVLGSVSAEIHDNLGQMLSVIKLNLSKLSRMVKGQEEEELIGLVRTQVSGVISDMRSISKTLSQDFISDFGLYEALKLEMERVQNTGFLKTELTTEGEPEKFNPKMEIVLFRITQELINNTIKHAEATTLTVNLNYNADKLMMTVADDGKGFDPSAVAQRAAGDSGNGLKNMQKRVKIIGGLLTLESSGDAGTRVKIEINTQKSPIAQPN